MSEAAFNYNKVDDYGSEIYRTIAVNSKPNPFSAD